MLVVHLAESGSPVIIPDAVGVQDGPDPEEVAFVDSIGRTVAIFKRKDVSLFSPGLRFADGASADGEIEPLGRPNP